MRLLSKLLLSFLAVVLVGVLVVSYLANQAAAREVRGFMFRGGMTTEAGLAQELAGYYQGHGSWEGVEALLDFGGMGGMMGMMGQRLMLADAEGWVVADTRFALIGQSLTAADLAEGVPVEVNGRRVGTLLAEGGMVGGHGFQFGAGLDPGIDLLPRVNRAIWLAALAAGGVALLVGGLFAYGLVQPLRRLTAAAAAIARGDLAQRVPVNSNDEIGSLATAFNAMAADLEKAERLRREMTADIAHELRNPLAVLQGNLEAVMDGVLPPTAENMQPLLDQTRLLSRLVDDLRTLALADAGQLGLHRAPSDPAVLARSALAQFAPQAEAKNVTLSSEIPAGLPTVVLDPERFAQVLGNLLSNAIRHTPPGGVVSLETSVVNRPSARGRVRDGDWLLTTVRDTGPGVAPEALPHLFDRFYRADRSRSRIDGGTGLGLAIARQLVEAHGGEIWAESTSAGATFSFTIPVGNNIARLAEQEEP